MEKMVLTHIGLLVTSYCNRNCRDCADLLPKRENCIYPLQDLIQDFTKLLEVVDYVEEVLIIGGETLLYQYLQDVIDFCSQQEKIGRIIVTTNGTIACNETLLESLKKNQVLVRVSEYPQDVAPHRKEIINTFVEEGITVEDLAGNYWFSMGSFHKRNRTEKEMEQVFQDCMMKYCVTLKNDGCIYYCSRQMAASEIPVYPLPLQNEIVNVRANDNLREEMERFLNLSSISTCDYCDGLSCKAGFDVVVPKGIQILDKAGYLELIHQYYEMQEMMDSEKPDEMFVQSVKKLIAFLISRDKQLIGLKEVPPIFEEARKWEDISKIDKKSFLSLLCALINHLTDDYTFEVIDQSDYLNVTAKYNKPNVITVGTNTDSNADLIITKEDLIEQAYGKYEMNCIMYDKLYLESRLEKLKSDSTIEGVICGSSYTQHGVFEKKLCRKIVSLSITGEDIPYSLLMAKKAMELNLNLKYLVIPCTYYQGYYDMSSDTAWIHKETVEMINIPILGNNRNYVDFQYRCNYLMLFDRIARLDQYVKERDQECIEFLSDREYFNETYKRPLFGGLKFDFHELDENAKYQSVQKTKELNERFVTEKGKDEVIKSITAFLSDLSAEVELVMFVPPMTKYLYEAYSDELKRKFYEEIYPLFQNRKNIHFYDWAQHDAFTEHDFADFEHLSENGAEKLTELLNQIISKL